MSVEALPDEDGIRDRAGGKVLDPKDRDELVRCALERAKALLTKQGAELRAGLYTPSDLAGLSIGVVGLMLAQILNGDIKVRDAKQAAEIAKIAMALSERVTDEAHADAKTDTPSGRAALIAKKDTLVAELRERGKLLGERFAEDTAAGAVDLTEFDLDDDDHPAASLHSVA